MDLHNCWNNLNKLIYVDYNIYFYLNKEIKMLFSLIKSVLKEIFRGKKYVL